MADKPADPFAALFAFHADAMKGVALAQDRARIAADKPGATFKPITEEDRKASRRFKRSEAAKRRARLRAKDPSQVSWATNGGIYLGMATDALQGEPRPGEELRYVGERHLFTLGPNSSGKSKRLLLVNAYDLTGWSMLIVDPKGEIAAMTEEHREKNGSEIVIINPFDILDLGSTGFNPVANLDPASEDFPDDALGIAEALIRVESKEPHWAESAQDLVCGLIMYSRLVMNEPTTDSFDPETGEIVDAPWPKEEEERGTLGHVRTLLGKPAKQIRVLAHKMNNVAAKFDCPELAVKAARFLDIDSENKELNSIISTALTQTRWLDSRPIKRDLSKGTFDFSQMKERPVTVYLVLPARRLGTHSTWLRLMITCVLQQLMKDTRKSKVPCLLMIDEMAQLGHLPAIERNLALMRGYGVKLWSVYQDLTQAQDVYERRWESFIANSGVLQAFAPQDTVTAEYLSRLTGTKGEDNFTYGGTIGPDAEPLGGNLGYSKISVPLMRPEDFRNMDDGYSITFSHKVKGPVRHYLPYPTGIQRLEKIMELDPSA